MSYWEDRANERMAFYHRNSDKTIEKINNCYERALADINKDIRRIFNKYSLSYDLSKTEARDLLNSIIPSGEIRSIRDKIKYIEDKDLKKYLMAQLNNSPYKARITRLEALKESLYINTKLIAQEEYRLSTSNYLNNINEAYYRNIFDIQKGLGIEISFAEMPKDTIETILKSKWLGANYSSRIWSNTDMLASRLEEKLIQCLMSGKTIRNLFNEFDILLRDEGKYGQFASERLVRTENTYMCNQAELESYKACGIDKYVYVATLDSRTSNKCREMDGKIVDVDKGMPGENLPPLHPYCRSTTIAYFGDMDYYRRARGEGTFKYKTYKEWNRDN